MGLVGGDSISPFVYASENVNDTVLCAVSVADCRHPLVTLSNSPGATRGCPVPGSSTPLAGG